MSGEPYSLTLTLTLTPTLTPTLALTLTLTLTTDPNEVSEATDEAIRKLMDEDEDDVDASGWTLEAWLRSIDLEKIFSDALLHHFAAGAIAPGDKGKQLTIQSVHIERQVGLFDLTTCYLLLTTYNSLLTTHYLLLTTHY